MYYSSLTDMNKLDQFEIVSKFEPHVAAQQVPVKLTEHIYLLWMPFVVSTLKSHGMFDLVSMTECACTSSIVDDVNDKLCMHFINLTLSEAMLAYVASDPACTTARGLWSMLEKQGEIAQRRVTEQRDYLETLKKDYYELMSNYYDYAKELVDDLKGYATWIPDEIFVDYVLKGLPSCYVDVAKSIRAGNIGGGDELLDLLVNEEIKLSNQKKEEETKLLKQTRRRGTGAQTWGRDVFGFIGSLFVLLLIGSVCYVIVASANQ